MLPDWAMGSNGTLREKACFEAGALQNPSQFHIFIDIPFLECEDKGALCRLLSAISQRRASAILLADSLLLRPIFWMEGGQIF
jgi:hypothetical protein